jgi:hypothetical protein
MFLPGSFLNARDFAFVGKFTEADAAEVEVSHVTTLAPAAEAAVGSPSAKLGLLFASCDNRCFSHFLSK